MGVFDASLFPKRLAAALEHAGKGPEDLAGIINRSPATVQSWLSGRYEPSLSSVVNTAEALEVSLEWLCGGPTNRENVLKPSDYDAIRRGYEKIAQGGTIIRETLIGASEK